MPRKPKTPTPMNKTERELMEALDRVKRGEPKNKKLAKLQAAGKLKVSLSGVALESGHSRTLIGTKDCDYPRVRAAVLADMQPLERSEPTTARDVINLLRQDIQTLRIQLHKRDSENAALIRRIRKVETNALAEIREAKRAQERGNRNPNEIAGKKFNKETGKVLDFPQPEDKEPAP